MIRLGLIVTSDFDASANGGLDPNIYAACGRKPRQTVVSMYQDIAALVVPLMSVGIKTPGVTRKLKDMLRTDKGLLRLESA